MILVSVGTTMFPFQRMTTLVERLSHLRSKHEPIIFQFGHTPPHFLDPHVTAVPFLPHRLLLRYMKESRVVISHGGPATIYQALSYGKRPWVLPREARYGEHLNNHQVDFAKFLETHSLIHLITPNTPIRIIGTSALSINPIKKNNRKLIGFLDSLLQSP